MFPLTALSVQFCVLNTDAPLSCEDVHTEHIVADFFVRLSGFV